MANITRQQIIGAAILAAAGASPALAQQDDLKAKADAYLRTAYPSAGPGAAVVIMDDGKIVYAAGHGLADVEAKLPITPQTVFRLGSITKQFAAAVVLQLAAEGKLSLSDPVSKYVPVLAKPSGDATIAQLLNHTVGVQSYTGIPGWMRDEKNTNRAYTTDEMITLFKDLPPSSNPGEEWSYNNSGYVLVGAVIEKVTGKLWHQAVEERITRPLGLKTIRYGINEERIEKMAKGYAEGEKGTEPARKLHMSIPHAAGALLGTVEDLAKWADALHDGKVVPKSYYALMKTPTKLPDGEVVPYGFALQMSKVRGREGIGHSGGIFGFSTNSIYIPAEDIFVAVLANSQDPATSPGIAMRRLAALAMNDPFLTFQKAKVDPAALESLFGVYKVPDGERQFYARAGKLYTRRTGGPEGEVFAAGGDRFFYGPESLNWFEIRRDSAGAHVMEMHQDGGDEAEKSVRSGPVPPEPKGAEVPRALLESYVGTYAAGPGSILVAMDEGGSLTLKLGGQRPVQLRAANSTDFQAIGVDARVVFRVNDGGVAKLVIHQGGRELPAERVRD